MPCGIANKPFGRDLGTVFSRIKFHLHKNKWLSAAKKTVFSPLYHEAFPTGSQSIRNTTFLAVDCEMTGLDPKKDSLLSIGWIEISNHRVKLSSANHMLVYAENSVGASAKIHGLRDNQLAGAASIGKVLSIFTRDACGKILIFHHAHLDLAFLQKAALETIGCPLLFPYIDTLQIEKSRLAMQNRSDSLQLNLCRQRYNLPPAFEHNALDDARATAELFLAQTASMNPKTDLQLKDLELSCT